MARDGWPSIHRDARGRHPSSALDPVETMGAEPGVSRSGIGTRSSIRAERRAGVPKECPAIPICRLASNVPVSYLPFLYDALMTFAEIIFVCLFVAAIYRLLRPVQQRLERWIYRRISSRVRFSKTSHRITDYRRTTRERKMEMNWENPQFVAKADQQRLHGAGRDGHLGRNI